MRTWLAASRQTVAASSFVRNSLALISGTVASQVVAALASLFLSRQFLPADFGDLANYNAWVSVLGLLSNMRYEHAIIVARDRVGANRVVALAMTLSLASFVLYAIIAAAIYWLNPASGYLKEIHGIVLYIPLGILPAVVTSAISLFNTRVGRFNELAIISVLQVVCAVALQLVFGRLQVKNGLVLGALLGYVLAGVIYVGLHLRNYRLRHIWREVTLDRMRTTAAEHLNFPRFALAADTINVVVQQFIPVFLTALFSPAAAGLYAFSTRVVRVPLFVISTAVSTLLRKQAVEHLRREGNLIAIFRTTTIGLALLAAVPFLVLGLYAGPIFGWLFGDQWIEAGRVVRILSPGIMLEFITLPLAVLFIATNRQRYSFIIQVVSLALMVAALMLGKYQWNSFIAACFLMSGAMIVVNGLTIALAGVASSAPPARETSAPA